MPISKFSTLNEMKDYVRKNKLNKGEIKLSMKKSVMLGLLDKGGHIHTGPRGSKAPVKKAPVKKDDDKDLFMNALNIMSQVAKSKNKKTEKDVDKDVVLSKKKLRKKIMSFKGKELEKLLNFNEDALKKIDSEYYGSNNWITLDGVKKTKSKMIKYIDRTTAGFGVGYNDKKMNDLLKLMNNYKTKF